ncbi:hypothetical protein Tco_0538217 [Tanacetum coccineum]
MWTHYDSDGDKGPQCSSSFLAKLVSIKWNNGATTSQVIGVHTDANQIFDNVNHLLTHEMHQEEHLDSDVESDIDDNTIPYHQNRLDSEVNQEQSLVNDSLRAELARCKQEMVSLERNKVKHDLDQTIIQRKPRSTPWTLKQAKLSQPTLYDGHALLNPTHTSVKVHDNEDSLVHAESLCSSEGTVPRTGFWLPAEELATQKSNPPKPVTPFVCTRPAKSQISTCLQGLNSWIPAFAHVINQQTDPCRYPSGPGEFKPVKAMFTEQIIPFYENVKQLVQKLDENIVTEVTEYMRIFNELDTEYERCVLEKKKDICSIVLAFDIVMPLSSNCLCEELRSNCDREHSKVVELEAEILKKQQMLSESEKRCAFIEKNHVNLQDQLQGKDDTIRNLQTHINITRMLNVGSTIGSFDKQALETELTQLKDALTSVRIQIDGYKVENVNLKRRYEELSKSNAYSRSTFTAKINALTAENAKLKTELSGKNSSGSTASEKPKVLAPGMYAISPKYIPPQRRVNRAVPTPLPKKQQGTFKKPPRTSNRPTQKPPV